jgi:hypothetical protein
MPPRNKISPLKSRAGNIPRLRYPIDKATDTSTRSLPGNKCEFKITFSIRIKPLIPLCLQKNTLRNPVPAKKYRLNVISDSHFRFPAASC